MPAKGTTKIRDRKKAKIIAEKKVGIGDLNSIAKANKVSLSTVQQIERRSSPEVLALADNFTEQLIAKSGQNVTAGLDAIAARIPNPNEPLSSVVAATKLSHDIYRLEKNLPTAINGRSSDDMALDFVRLLMEHNKPKDAWPGIVRNSRSLDRYGLTQEQKEAFALRLEAGEITL